MPDARAQLELEITFDEKGAVKGVKKINKGVKDTQKATEQATKSSKGFLSNLKAGYLAAAAAAAVAFKAVQKVINAAAIQEKAERTLAAAMKQAGTFTREAFEENLRYAGR